MAPLLIEPSPPCGVDALAVDELGTYDWLRRAGLEKHTAALEKAGYTTARLLYGLPEGTLKDDCGIKDKLELGALSSLLAANADNARGLHAFTSPDYARVRAAFLETFQPVDSGGFGSAARELLAAEFATMLCDRAGHGTISLLQLERCLEAHKGGTPAAALAAARSSLVEHTRPEEPPAPPEEEPSAWVHGWLKSHKLEAYSSKLLEQKFETRDDLLLEPRLDLKAIVDLGVDKAADARRLLKLITQL